MNIPDLYNILYNILFSNCKFLNFLLSRTWGWIWTSAKAQIRIRIRSVNLDSQQCFLFCPFLWSSVVDLDPHWFRSSGSGSGPVLGIQQGNWPKKPEFQPFKKTVVPYLPRYVLWPIAYIEYLYFSFKNPTFCDVPVTAKKSDQDPDPDPHWFGSLDLDPDPHWG